MVVILIPWLAVLGLFLSARRQMIRVGAENTPGWRRRRAAFRANLPLLWGILVFTLLLIGFPQIATWLPSLMQD